jgi:hypothetical protein
MVMSKRGGERQAERSRRKVGVLISDTILPEDFRMSATSFSTLDVASVPAP